MFREGIRKMSIILLKEKLAYLELCVENDQLDKKKKTKKKTLKKTQSNNSLEGQ